MWTVPIVGVLGFIASGLEGLGISLLIPALSLLLSDPGIGEAQGPLGFLFQFASMLDEDVRLLAITATMFALVVAKAVIQTANGIFAAWIDGKASHDIRCDLSRRLLRVGYPFFLREDPARLVTIMSTEAWRASDAIQIIFSIVSDAGAVVVFGFLLFLVNWKLFLVITVVVIAIRGLQNLIVERVKSLGQRVTVANRTLGDRMIVLSVDLIRVVRVFGQEKREELRFIDASKAVRNSSFLVSRVLAMQGPVLEVLHAALFLGILLGAHASGMEVPVLITFLVLLYRMQPYLRSLGQARFQIASTLASIREVEWLLDPSGKPQPPTGSMPFSGLRQEITFEEVGFGYPNRPEAGPVLVNVSFSIRAHAVTALIGPSGAGKSTVVNILCRLLEPTSGRIMVDGTNLAEIDPASWRGKIALAGQDIDLVDGTIAENIVYGAPDASEADIREAARLSDIHGFITTLPDGYGTMVGNRGLSLSGGQRQRIGIARALIRRPQLLILDEATNAMDVHSEAKVMSLLDQVARTMTIIVVSHRASTLSRCEEGIVLEAGRIVEHGKLNRLAAASQLGLGARGDAPVEPADC
jgi:ATP-binding cassette, subfamily B, bacterial MsbA